jgi:hypothetical protein
MEMAKAMARFRAARRWWSFPKLIIPHLHMLTDAILKCQLKAMAEELWVAIIRRVKSGKYKSVGPN